MDSNIKLSNVLGAPFRSYVLSQFDIRANRNSTGGTAENKRGLEEVLFLANKTAWVRLASSVNVIGRTLEKINENEKAAKPYDVTTKQIYNALGTGLLDKEDSLAQDWILEAGTSVQVGDGINLREGISADNRANLTGVTLGAYGLGGTTELGFVPMPGLTSVTIETLGRLGSLRQATVNFRVNNLNQVNVIEALYFRLGYSMILEWGHTQYYLNDGTFQTDNIYGIEGLFNDNLRKEDIITKINTKTRETDGNYGGMYGIVTGFNFNATQDGGYDCTVKLIGHGAIMDSTKANQSYTLPSGQIEEYERLQEYILKQIAIQKKINEDLAAQLAAGSANAQVKPAEPPEAASTSLTELYKLIHKYIHKESTYTYTKFLIEYGFPIPTVEALEAKAFGSIDGPLSGTEWVVFIPDSAFNVFTDPAVKAGYIKKFAGFYIRHLTEFLRVQTSDTLGASLDLTVLNRLLKEATFGYDDGTGKETDALDLFFDLKGSYLNKAIGAIATYQLGPKGREVPIPGKIEGTTGYEGWPDLVSTTYGTRYDKPFYQEDNPNSTVEQYIVGYVDLKITVNVPAEWVNYSPTANQVTTAIDQWLGGANSVIYPAISLKHNGNKKANSVAPILDNDFTITATWTGIKVPNVAYNGPKEQADVTADFKGKEYPAITRANNVAPSVPVTLTITTNNLTPFYDFKVNGKKYDATGNRATSANTGTADTTITQADIAQTKSPEGFSSALQAMLTIVQAQAQAAALKKTGVYVHDILETTRKFYTDGALNNVFDATGKTTNPDFTIVKGENFTEFKLLNYAIKGFSSAIIGDSSVETYKKVDAVDFKALCKAYVIKYKQGGVEGVVNDVRSPTYITLGYLLAFLNNMCLIYDSNQSRKTGAPAVSTNPIGTKKHPFIYIDFNPTTNFCFTIPQQFSIDPTICMIPMQKGQKYYRKLFTTDEIIKKLSPPLFNTETNNVVTQDLEKGGASFTTNDGTDSAKYKGNLMSILVNTQYLLDLCLNMSRNDPEHAVNLKPFLDQILIDINKCLGGVNSFRVSYLDESNTIQIVDDQWVPLKDTVLSQTEQGAKNATTPVTSGQLPLDGSIIASPEAPGSISIVGTKSITREFRLNTVISSKLASKIAISAQAETGSVNSKDHSPYSHLNTFYEDRYSRSKEDPTIGNNATVVNKSGATSDQEAADLFNSHVQCLYGKFEGYNPKNIEAAKNYYLERMSKAKSSNPLTSASPYIPLELELTVDGISGIMMMNGFTVPNDRLPYTYQGEGGKTKIAFIVTGLVHTIQNNEWLTKIKGQMIKLKTPVLIETPGKRSDALQISLASITTLSDEFNSKYPWSAGFISYVMKQAGVSNFPYNSYHSEYAQALRSKPNGWQVLDPGKTKIQAGDLVVANRNGNTLTFTTRTWSGAGHGDIITAVNGNVATGIGGNVGNTVGKKSLALSGGQLGKTDYFVVLRPPQGDTTSIVNKALPEYDLWHTNKWKETSPDALPYLREYYKIIGITI